MAELPSSPRTYFGHHQYAPKAGIAFRHVLTFWWQYDPASTRSVSFPGHVLLDSPIIAPARLAGSFSTVALGSTRDSVVITNGAFNVTYSLLN